MKCALIGPTYPYRGGIAHYTTLLCHHMRERHQVAFISFRRQYPGWLFPGRTDLDPSLQPLEVECQRLIDPFNPWTWVQAARRIRALDPDLLVLQWWVPFWAPVWSSIIWLVQRWANPKIVFVCHNVLPHEARPVDRLLAQWVLGQGDAMIVHSQRDRGDLTKLLPKANVRLSAHPTYEVFAKEVRPASEARSRLSLATDAPTILFFGFVRPYKGLRYLIEALPAILARLDVHLLIAGEFWDDVSPYLEQIRALGLEEQCTVLDHYIPNEQVSDCFAASDLVVVPYVDATQSGIVQMAFGFGVPVVTTKVGGLGEAVQDGVSGLLVPPQDSQALAAAIIRYFEEDLGPGMRANIQASKERFSWEQLVTTIEELASG